MKRITLLTLALLCLILRPALAEEPDATADLCAQLLPGYACVEGEMGEGICALLADSPDGERRFYGCVLQDGAWEVTESTPLPAGAELYLEEDWPLYDTCVIGFYHPEREDLPWMAHYVTWDGEGWAITLSTMNAGDLIRYEDGYIGSDMYSEWYGVPTFALDVTAVDWLNLPATFEEAMALMDTTGCEVLNADWSAWEEEADPRIPDAAAVAFGQAHLPGYTVYDGRAFENSALLLADDENGVRYFFGCVQADGEWVITRSTPLPEDSWCETYHTGWNWLRVWIPLPREKQTLRTGFTEVRCTVVWTGSAWQVISLDVADGYMGFSPHSVYDDTGSTYWGDLPLDRDVTRIDWNAVPGSFQQAVDMMADSGWMIVGENGAALYAGADTGSAILGRYLLGAPVMRLNEQDGMVQVQVISSDVTGWMAAEHLLPASEQDVYDQENGYLSSRYRLDEIYLGEDDAVLLLRTVLHEDASALPVSADRTTWLGVLGVCPAGCCYHVYAESADASAYLPLAELPLAQQATALALPHAPDMSVYNAIASDTAFIAMLENQKSPAMEGGQLRLACGVLLDDGWEITLSNLLPEGAWAMMGDMEGTTGTLRIRFPDAGTWEYTLRYQDGWTDMGGEYADFTLFPAEVPDLADHTILDRWEGAATRMYLATNADGETVFLGCERTAAGWNITESAPFPDVEVHLNTYHADEGYMEIDLPEDGLAVTLQEDGRWLLTWANDVSIGDTGLWFGMLGPYYCDVNLEQDITRVDWAALPTAYEDWLLLADASHWAVVTGEGTALYSEDGSVIGQYQPATPVYLLDAAEGWYRVAVNGGSVTGWMDASALLVGENQLTIEAGHLAVAEDGRMRGVNQLVTVAIVPLLDAPEGEPVLGAVESLVLLGKWPDGWLHVLDESTGLDGFVREEDCITLDEWLDRLHDEYGI